MPRNGDESRKQQIRAAAVRCFVRRGFTATRLLDIARTAGLSKGGVYFYYSTKEALFADVLAAQREEIESRWSRVPSTDEPADQTLHRLIAAHLSSIEEEPEDTRLHHLLISMAPQDGSFRDTLKDGVKIVRDLYAAVIARGLEQGVFTDGEPDQLADLVLAMVQGLAAQTAIEPEGRLPMRPERVAEAVGAMLGAAAPPPTMGTRPAAVAARPALQS